MAPSMMEKLKQSLTLHEGRSNFPYVDIVGKITAGIGYNLTDRGLSDEWIDKQFVDDVNYFHDQLNEFSWFRQLNEDRKIVLIDMAFMGIKTFLKFTRLIQALKDKDYKKASEEMLNSKWATQVKGRAFDLAEGMLTGIYTIKS